MNTRPWRLGFYSGALALAVTLLPWRPGVVVGDSMSPTIRNGSLYLMDCSSAARKALRRGDVVVFKADGMTYIKRVAAVGGDTIYLLKTRGDTELYDVVMDWQLPSVRRAYTNNPWRSVKLVARRLPPGMVFVLGDNLANSVDSRSLGPITTEQVLGKMLRPPAPAKEIQHVAVRSRELRASGSV